MSFFLLFGKHKIKGFLSLCANKNHNTCLACYYYYLNLMVKK